MLLDLALILVVAGVVTIIFKALKQPLVLGYIVAGILTGPYIGWVPTATQVASVEFWGKIGVIFLLFGLGLEFSFKQLKKVGGPGATTVFSEAVVMFCMGFLIAKIFGWETITALFVGAMLSISSTSIIIKTFDDLKIGGKKSSQLVLGALICEDIVAILLLVLLAIVVTVGVFSWQAGRFWQCMGAIVSIVIPAAPFLLVSPMTYRCFCGSYIFWIVLLYQLLALIPKTRDKIFLNEKLQKYIKVIAFLAIGFYTCIYASIMRQDFKRLQYIKSEAARGTTEVTISHLSNENFVRDITLKLDFAWDGYKDFYGIAPDLKIIVREDDD